LNIRAAERVRNGSRDDQAHPPIHPVKSLEQNEANSIHPRAWDLYEFITKHFLATFCDDAKGAETEVTIGVGLETFSTSGLVVHERNFLDAYQPFEYWTNKEVPRLVMDQRVPIQTIDIVESRTVPPVPYDESDLIKLMDQNGIGTDATMHDHIKTIQDRNYVVLKYNDGGADSEDDIEANNNNNRSRRLRFAPTAIGISLIDTFIQLSERCSALDLSRVELRAEMESDFTSIASGQLARSVSLQNHLSVSKTIFDHMCRRKDAMKSYVARRYQSAINDEGLN